MRRAGLLPQSAFDQAAPVSAGRIRGGFDQALARQPIKATPICHRASSTAVFFKTAAHTLTVQIAWLIKTSTALAHKDLRQGGIEQKSRRKHQNQQKCHNSTFAPFQKRQNSKTQEVITQKLSQHGYAESVET
ncbi:MAG: hypothetical protein KAV00_14285 [Phycisphaerae bacterium]|nr:hypothetical protein [Phycisphaerae bacterium]